MIVTLDGPAGAGKSSVARELAGRLGFRFLDTGAMYRAVALAAMDRQVPWDAPDQIANLAAQIDIQLQNDRVFLDGEDVSDAIRTPTVTAAVHHVADHPGVRERLVQLQRQAAKGGDFVTEGRDQGTVAFPDAACKIYLTASPEERARRRLRELRLRGESMELENLLADQNLRDRRDETRAVGRLMQAADAVEVVTDGMSQTEVVDRLEEIVRGKAEM
ncbi:MAG: (d)CMP kinase [Pirellulaceae bacterium]